MVGRSGFDFTRWQHVCNRLDFGRATIEAGFSDVEVVTSIDLTTGGTGVVLRSTDRYNFLRIVLLSTGWQLQKTAAGVTTIVSKGNMAIPLKARHSLMMALSGPVIVVSLDGALVGRASETFNQSATRFGLVCSCTGARSWDSFLVRKR